MPDDATEPAELPAHLIDAVAAESAQDAGADAALLGDFLPAIGVAAQTGERFNRTQLQRYRAQGQLAARRGVALRSVLDLFLSATWRIWPQLPVTKSADLDRIVLAGQALFRSLDDVVGSLTEGFQLARRSLVREQESARREFIDDLLAGQGDAVDLADRAHGFGLDLASPHAVAVVQAETPFADGAPLTATVERAVLGSKGDADVLVTSKAGLLVVVFAAPDAAAIKQVSGQLASALRHKRTPRLDRTAAGAKPGSVRLIRAADVGAWQVAIGRALPGPAGVRASYDQARETLELAGRLELDAPVVDADDLLVYRMLLRDRPAITDLVDAVLSPLLGTRGGAGPLLDTLAVYFDTGGNTAETARTMHLSVRAVGYRLERVHRLTGHDPLRSVDRFTLHAAVLGARLLGWPATAGDSATLPE